MIDRKIEKSYREEELKLAPEKETGRQLNKKEEAINEKSKLIKKIESISLDSDLKPQAKKEAEDIRSLDENQKIGRLLKIVEEGGVKKIPYVIRVAKELDPYFLDSLHDVLIEKGYYEKLIK